MNKTIKNYLPVIAIFAALTAVAEGYPITDYLKCVATPIIAKVQTNKTHDFELKDFNELFKQTIGQASKLNTKIEQFSNKGEVGWQQVFTLDDKAIQITVFLSPPSTFAIKHLCVADDLKILKMTCTSNLGETWTSTKNTDGDWIQSDTMHLDWSRKLSDIAYD